MLHSWFPCQRHGNNKLVGGAVTMVGKHLVDGEFAYDKLQRIGNYWCRTILSIDVVVEADLGIIYEPARPRVSDLRHTVSEYLWPR